MERPFPAYAGDEPYVFVCYSHDDAELVYREISWLRENGVNIWYDEGIAPAREFPEVLARAIENARHVLFYVSPRSVASRYCRNEIYFALEHDISVVASYLEATVIPPGLELTTGSIQALPRHEIPVADYRRKLLAVLTEAGRVTANGLATRRSRESGRRAQFRSPVSWMAAAMLIVIAVGAGWWFYWPVHGRAPIRSIAVLPLKNLSGDPAQDYFADGMTEELITDLARVGALKVISRTSIMRFKSTTAPLPQVAQELHVDGIIEGSVQREGGRVRVTAQLIDGRTDEHIWAESYERDMSSVLALQSAIARAIVGRVRAAVTPAERARLAAAPSVNPAAYEDYLKGRQHWNNLTPQDVNTALKYFHLALKQEPDSARAYAGIALVWGARQQMGMIPPAEAAPKAKAAALEAIGLDPTLADAHAALAAVAAWSDWDWAAAGREFRKAIELNPNFAHARAYYSHYLLTMRRPDEAMAQIRRALELDPLNGLYRALYAVDLFWVRRYDDAITQARRVLRTTPRNPVAYSVLLVAYSLKGMDKAAMDVAKARISLRADSKADRALENGFAEGGYALAMRRVADELAARSRTSFVAPNNIALYYLLGGDKASALDWLEKSYEMRDPNLPYLGMPVFDSLRSEPRFKAIVRGLHLLP
jgi:TolB-like protein